jgi:hypothetical protein
MGKTYNVVFNSAIAGSGNNSNQTFFYDWSELEQGQYKCSFSMICQVGANPNLNVVVGVFMDLGQSETFVAQPFNTGVLGANYMTPSFIGTLGVNNLLNTVLANTTVYAYSNFEDNPPFYLQKRPPSNSIQIGIYIVRGTPFPSTYNPVLIGNYTLTLHLEKLD